MTIPARTNLQRLTRSGSWGVQPEGGNERAARPLPCPPERGRFLALGARLWAKSRQGRKASPNSGGGGSSLPRHLSIHSPMSKLAHYRLMRFIATIFALCIPTLDSLAAEAVTSLPPQVVFIPLPSAYQVAKHPTLPVLYVGCYTPGQTN